MADVPVDERSERIEWAVETLDEALGEGWSGERHVSREDAWEAWEIVRTALEADTGGQDDG